MFYDPNQDLFGGMAKPMVNRLREGSGFVSYLLSTNCRNTAPIATFVAQAGGLKSTEVLLDRPTADVEKVFCRNDSDMRSKVSRHINDLVRDRVACDQIVLLSPRIKQNSCLADGLEGGPDIKEQDDGAGSSNSILYATIGSFKGLERSIVVLVDVWELESPQARRDLYVGTSRARTRLTVFLGEFLKDPWTEAVQRHAERMFHEE
jgi:superfamily I DNA/RNA helicase